MQEPALVAIGNMAQQRVARISEAQSAGPINAAGYGEDPPYALLVSELIL